MSEHIKDILPSVVADIENRVRLVQGQRIAVPGFGLGAVHSDKGTHYLIELDDRRAKQLKEWGLDRSKADGRHLWDIIANEQEVRA